MKNAIRLTQTTASLMLMLATTFAYSQCKEEQEALDKLQKEYNVLFVDLAKQAEKLKRLMPDTTSSNVGNTHHATFDVEFTQQRYVFDLVEVTMKNRSLSLDVPQVTMKTKSLSIPYSKWEWKVTNVGLGIKTKTLVMTNGMKRVSFKLPEVRMERREIVTKIPEFRSEKKEIIFDIPEFTLRSPIPEEGSIPDESHKARAIATAADSLNATGIRLERDQKEKSKLLLTNLFGCIDLALEDQRIASNHSFQSTIKDLNKAIKDVQSKGLNPAAIESDDGTTVDLIRAKDEMIAANKLMNESIDKERAELKEQLASIIADLDENPDA